MDERSYNIFQTLTLLKNSFTQNECLDAEE